MTKLDWRALALAEGVYREPTPDGARLVLWLTGKKENGFQHWERLTNVPGAEVAEDKGVCFTQATSMPAREKLHGVFGKMLARVKKSAGGESWLVPTGGYAEQVQERQTGLLLVWALDEGVTLDEPGLKARWASGQRFRKLGKNLFVVSPPQAGFVGATAAAELLENPRAQAEQLLATARKASDRGVEATALTDLGIAWLRSGDPARAQATLQEALARARQEKDRAREDDASSNLGLALVAAGQPDQAQELLGQSLASARETGDRHKEKLALANLAAALACKRDFGEAITACDHGLILARELGDRTHEADLLWFQAIQYAEMGQQEQAASRAQAAIDIHATLRSPHIAWLSSHLKRFRPLTAISAAPAVAVGYYTGAGAVATRAAPPTMPPCDPSVLRTAMTAVKAMETSVGSGIKTVPEATHRQRLEVCAACPHHTGMRCQLSGSFTRAKAWLPYESCPVTKWP